MKSQNNYRISPENKVLQVFGAGLRKKENKKAKIPTIPLKKVIALNPSIPSIENLDKHRHVKISPKNIWIFLSFLSFFFIKHLTFIYLSSR